MTSRNGVLTSKNRSYKANLVELQSSKLLLHIHGSTIKSPILSVDYFRKLPSVIQIFQTVTFHSKQKLKLLGTTVLTRARVVWPFLLSTLILAIWESRFMNIWP